ncbi:hypothetical protein vseg_004886 [Gypsophila vaccaria]
MKKWAIFCTLVLLSTEYVSAATLMKNFYKERCPNLETIVGGAVTAKYQQTFVAAPATLRLFFHDCFVEGCDASVMILSSEGDAEVDAPNNLSLGGEGFDTVIKAKKAVEAQCPGVVSCADILALATRDVVYLSGGPYYAVELGRLDGVVSKASNVQNNLPDPGFNYEQLKAMFAKHNLNEVDLVALSGAHTIGTSHCNHVSKRIYGFSPFNPTDPSMNPTYAQQLMQVCPPNANPNILAVMDPVTPQTFDNLYYQNLAEGKGLFTSDQVLFSNPKSRLTVEAFAMDMSTFSSRFVKAMTKLGRVGVKTSDGEIRRDCTMIN